MNNCQYIIKIDPDKNTFMSGMFLISFIEGRDAMRVISTDINTIGLVMDKEVSNYKWLSEDSKDLSDYYLGKLQIAITARETIRNSDHFFCWIEMKSHVGIWDFFRRSFEDHDGLVKIVYDFIK